jgi:hypothetical protein
MEIEISARDIELNFLFPPYVSDKNEPCEKQQCLEFFCGATELIVAMLESRSGCHR